MVCTDTECEWTTNVGEHSHVEHWDIGHGELVSAVAFTIHANRKGYTDED